MKASPFEFRFRLLLILGIVVLGFSSPWIEFLHLGTRSTTWLWLGFQIGGMGIFSSTAIRLVTGLVILLAALGAGLRVWGTAYLGTATVNNARMLAGSSLNPGQDLTGKVLADGPYRYMRNPLYLGTLFTISAVAVLMPPSGAAISVGLLTIFQFRLILAEEAFLARTLGEPYLAYRRAVPRLIPRFRTNIACGGQTARWGAALVGEIFPLGVLASFIALSWQYNSELLIQAVLVSFGLSLIARALIIPKPVAAETNLL